MTIDLSEEDSNLLTEALSYAASAAYGYDDDLFLRIIQISDTLGAARAARDQSADSLPK